jgi:predicted AAA+ superfamily ATPase
MCRRYAMKRFAGERLNEWLGRSQRKPLVIRGARQVGKSTLVRQFAAEAGLLLNEVNLERNPILEEVFASLDTTAALREIEGLVGRPVTAPGSLLFLDEIQATPSALQMLRYLYEEYPELPVVAAGSLLEFVLAEHKFSMPVGRVEYLHLGPMTFEEFLLECDANLLTHVRGQKPGDTVAKTTHERLVTRQREYLFVGGMPEVVKSFADNGQMSDVVRIQGSVLASYEDDFAKYALGKALLRLQKVFNYIPRGVGKKMKYSNVSSDEASREMRSAVELLAKARVLAQVFHSNCSGLPLHSDINELVYKPLFLDVGLVNRACGLDWLAISALNERKLLNEGAIAEQFIGQHLLYHACGQERPRLCYWLREGRSSNAEVDYVLSRGDVIVPVEVKAGKSGALKSLHQFVLGSGVELGIRFDLNPISIQRVSHMARRADEAVEVSYDLLSLPLYLVDQLPRLIDEYRAEKGTDGVKDI